MSEDAGYPATEGAATPAVEAQPQVEQQPISIPQLIEAMKSAADVMSLMATVAEADRSDAFEGRKASLFRQAHENAVRLQDRESALMYGNRVAAEQMEETVRSLHQAVGGMTESAGRHAVAAETMRASADTMARMNSR